MRSPTVSSTEPQSQRLQRILSAAGIASRRGAEELIREGRVSVNGETARVGDSADPRDVVAVDGEAVRRETLAYWMLHKPRGVITTASDPEGRPTVLDMLPAKATRRFRLFPVGRLDLETEGLVLLTNDGTLANVLMHPSYGCEREYRVTAKGRLSRDDLRRLAEGVVLEDGPTARARVANEKFDSRGASTVFLLTLTEGRKRQIRRALQALGHPVLHLLRVRMGPLQLGNLECGNARRLFRRERDALLELVSVAGNKGATAHPKRATSPSRQAIGKQTGKRTR